MKTLMSSEGVVEVNATPPLVTTQKAQNCHENGARRLRTVTKMALAVTVTTWQLLPADLIFEQENSLLEEPQPISIYLSHKSNSQITKKTTKTTATTATTLLSDNCLAQTKLHSNVSPPPQFPLLYITWRFLHDKALTKRFSSIA